MTQLADGLIAFVKQDCATCEMVQPVLQELIDAGSLSRIITQDDPAFPAVTGLDVTHDHDLGLSWHADIETVPTLMKVSAGVESDLSLIHI